MSSFIKAKKKKGKEKKSRKNTHSAPLKLFSIIAH